MAKPIPLDEQIIAALTRPCRSDEARSVLDSALTALRDLSARADEADVASLNPLAPAREAMAHRSRAGDLRFEADRLDASVSALRERVDELSDAEAAVRTEAAEAAVRATRDELAAEIARDFPNIIFQLTSLAKRITENDHDIARLHMNIPSAEAIGRGISPNFYEAGTPLRRIAAISCPMPQGPWPAWSDTPSGWVWRGLGLAAQSPRPDR